MQACRAWYAHAGRSDSRTGRDTSEPRGLRQRDTSGRIAAAAADRSPGQPVQLYIAEALIADTVG